VEIKEITGLPDYSEIIELINAEWPREFGGKTDDEKIGEMVRSHQVQTDTVKYLIEEQKIIGFYRYTLWPRKNPDSDKAHTMDIAVIPARQNQGLGIMLMTDLIKDCREKDFNQLLSRSMRNNPGSIRLHQSLDFTVYLETEDSIVWEINPQFMSLPN